MTLEDFSGSYCLLSFECMYVSLVDDSSDVCLGLCRLVGGWLALFGLLNCGKAILFIYECMSLYMNSYWFCSCFASQFFKITNLYFTFELTWEK